MDWFIPLAAKSFLIAGGALLLLKLLKNRSASDRSWIAHLALGGLLLLPVATFALPTLDVAGPEFLVGKAKAPSPASVQLPAAPLANSSPAPLAVDPGAGSAAPVAAKAIDWPFWSYAVPAALLLLLTLMALGRLFVLKARATVLIDAPWLTALARAQQRMGFKHGTALLTSNDLPSPISWGVVRPVIVLNSEAALAHDEAEAIITHELAHVAHLDWAKLLLSRIAVALFWFNPFVWLLAREAHQLREEAADDTVLATEIDETDYARLLVGVARHECRGLLIGAHGVAPGRNSLARRVKRVLDGAAKRAPGGWRWGSAVAFFAAGMAVPVAALNLVPVAPATGPGAAEFADAAQASPYYAGTPAVAAPASPAEAAKVAEIVADAPVATATVAGTVVSRSVAPNGATSTVMDNGMIIARAPNGATSTIYPPDKNGRRRVVAVSPNGAIAEAFADANGVPAFASAIAHPHSSAGPRKPKSAIDRAIEMKAVGVTPEYVAAIRQVAPQLRLDHDDIVELKAVGVSPEFVQELARLGYRNLDAGDLAGAYAVGVRSDYVRSLASAGYGRLTMDQLTELRAIGVTARDIERFRAAGYGRIDVDKLVELKALGITPEELRASERYDNDRDPDPNPDP